MLRVRSCVAHSHAAEVLKDGDLVLAVNGQPVTSYGHVEGIVAACSLATMPPPKALPSFTHHAPDVPQENTQAMALTAAITSASGLDTDCSDPADGLNSSAGTAGILSSSAGKAGGLCMANATNGGQHHSAQLIRAATPSSLVSDSPGTITESQEGGVAMPSVSLTIFRAPSLEEVNVRLGSEDGLGTCRLIHWCGAMFQVGWGLGLLLDCSSMLMDCLCVTAITK